MRDSLLNHYLPADYQDTYHRKICSDADISPEALLTTMFSDFPGWIDSLFKLRNTIVKPFGIETGKIDISKLIKEKNDQEVVLGQDDKHLEFLVSIQVIPTPDNIRDIQVSTIVKYHNMLGKVYFFFIRPFHRLIVPAMLKRALKPYHS